MNLRERLVDPKSPERRPRRAAYALPTLFTAGNVFFGFYALIEILQGAMQLAQGSPANQHFVKASLAIGLAVFLDGLDGRIARMTNTVSDFGREMDSLADVIASRIALAAAGICVGRAIRAAHRRSRSQVLRLFESRRILLLVYLSAVRRHAPGALQYPKKSHAEKSRPAGS